MKHKTFKKVKEFISVGLFPLLEGEAGTGKSTLAKEIANDMDLPFYSMSMTKQTSVNNIIGFKSVTGDYIPSIFREAFENGGVMLLDEIDASDPNTLLCLNTIENGYMTFPDGLVNKHKDFILIATSNPSHLSSIYTGRSKLDFSTKDRFITVQIPLDDKLEESITDKESVQVAKFMRKLFLDNGVSKSFTMRDTIRYYKLQNLKITKADVVESLLGKEIHLKEEVSEYLDNIVALSQSFNDAEDFNDLWDMYVKKRKVLENESKN